jgi:hypothetical protein
MEKIIEIPETIKGETEADTDELNHRKPLLKRAKTNK